MNTTPAGNEPHRPGGPLAPTAPGNTPTATLQPLTRTQKILTGIVVGAVLVIATLGFIGSYSAVTHLATTKGFGQFAHAFPIAVDAGIIAFLALDLLLTWRRIAFPLLRYTAWGLTTATISFNAVAAWPDPVGVSMHGVIPILFVIAVEAARHAVGRIAEITADKHLEGPNPSRWLLNPLGTFILWRRQRLWGIRTWDQVLGLEQERRIFKGKLRKEYGRGWRRTAPADQLLILRLATKDGLSITEAMALPEKEAAKQRATQQRIADEQREAENKRRREQEAYEREQKRLDEEAAAKAEAERIENERQAVALQKEKAEAERERIIADAKTQAELADIARREQQAQAELDRQQREEQEEADRRARQEQIDHARRLADEEKRRAEAAANKLKAEEEARAEAERKLTAERRAAEVRTALANQHPANSEPRTTSPANSTNREPARTSTPGTSANPGTANREPATNQANRRTTNPANLTDRAATKQNQVIAVLELIDELGFDATTLSVVMDRTGMTKTTAYHRLTEARGVWNQRKAS